MSEVFNFESSCVDRKYDVNEVQRKLIKILSSDDYSAIYRSPRRRLSPLHLAIISGDISLVKKYCNEKIVNDITERTLVAPLHLAIEFVNNNIETRIQIINVLLENGADINIKDKFEESVLYKATRSVDNQMLVPYLLSRGVNALENDYTDSSELILQKWLRRDDIEERYKFPVREIVKKALKKNI